LVCVRCFNKTLALASALWLAAKMRSDSWMYERLVEVNIYEYDQTLSDHPSLRKWRAKLYLPMCNELRMVANAQMRPYAMLSPGHTFLALLRNGTEVGRVRETV
jgi:hypothetical protein